MNIGNLVVITYLPSAAQGRELEMALEGWRRYYREKCSIVIVGEGLEGIASLAMRYDALLVESPRVPNSPGNYRAHLDYVSCLKKVRELYSEVEGFILVADDCYCVSEFGIEDILVPKVNSMRPFAMNNLKSANAWRRDKARTRQMLESEGQCALNFTTHVPIYYEWDGVQYMWDMYDMENTSAVLEDIYYNIKFSGRKVVDLSQPNFYRFPVWDQWMDEGALKKALEGDCIWVCNAVNGYNEKFEKIMLKHYGLE